jgi:hypothetical protein
MLLIPPAPYRPRRHASRSPKAPALPPLEVLEVSDVTYDPELGLLYLAVVFNTTAQAPLNDPSAASAAKWNARYQGKRYQGLSLSPIDATRQQIEMAPGAADAGPDELNYTNAPSDIADLLGRQLAAFSGLPL